MSGSLSVQRTSRQTVLQDSVGMVGIYKPLQSRPLATTRRAFRIHSQLQYRYLRGVLPIQCSHYSKRAQAEARTHELVWFNCTGTDVLYNVVSEYPVHVP